nr:hypothetical protein Iba_chr11aCG13750 [Ipomoea batatas]
MGSRTGHHRRLPPLLLPTEPPSAVVQAVASPEVRASPTAVVEVAVEEGRIKTVGGGCCRSRDPVAVQRATVLLHSPPPNPPEKKENEGTASPRLSGYLLPLMSYVGHTVAKPQPEPQGVVAAVLVRAPCQKQRPLPSLPSVRRKTEEDRRSRWVKD